MEREDLQALLTPEALALLDEFAELDATRDALAAVTTLRRAGADARTSAAVLTQLKLRRRARAKLGDFADRMLFTEDGLAQASRLQVAAHHANRFRTAQVRRLADLGCGIGADSLAFAALGFDLTAVDADEVTAAIATHNLAIFSNATVRHARAEDLDLAEFDGVFLDPARRAARTGPTERGASRRLADPDDWQPSLEFAFGCTDAGRRAVGVKLGPAIDHDLLPPDAEAQWVSVDGELVECGVWLGPAAREGIRRSALVLRDGAANELGAPDSPDEARDPAVGELGGWLHEPDPALIRGRFIGDLARQLGGRTIAPSIAWLTTDDPAPTPLAQSFRVLEVLPLDTGSLKRMVKARGIGVLEIKKRGVDLDPAEFRKKLAPKGPNSATLICTRLGERRVAILAERESAS